MHPSITLVLNSTDRFTAESRWKIWYLLNSETLNILFTGGAKRTAARVGNTDQVNICIKRKTDCQSWTKSKLEATKHAVSRMCYVNSCHCGQIRDSEDNDETDCSANNADEIGLQGSRFFFQETGEWIGGTYFGHGFNFTALRYRTSFRPHSWSSFRLVFGPASRVPVPLPDQLPASLTYQLSVPLLDQLSDPLPDQLNYLLDSLSRPFEPHRMHIWNW